MRKLMCLLLCLLPVPALAQEMEMLVTVLEVNDKKSVHQVMVKQEGCRHLLKSFADHKKAGATMKLTLQQPPATGNVVEIYCVQSDGKIIAP